MKTFYLDSELWQEPYALTGPEANHLAKVLRVGTGEAVRLIDGMGRTGVFTVVSVAKKRVELECVSIEQVASHSPRVVLALGWAKGNRRGWLMEKAVELQASGLWFWQAEYSQGRTPKTPKESWTGKLLAAAKQCSNPWLPEIAMHPGGIDSVIESSTSFSRRFLLYEDHENSRILTPADVTGGGDVLCVLGPEGGFTAEEANKMRTAGFEAVTLGDSVLRWETAALSALSLFWWGRQHA